MKTVLIILIGAVSGFMIMRLPIVSHKSMLLAGFIGYVTHFIVSIVEDAKF